MFTINDLKTGMFVKLRDDRPRSRYQYDFLSECEVVYERED